METSSRALGTPSVANDPVPFPALAGEDELARLFGSILPDAAFLIEPTTWLLGGANQRLLAILERRELELESELSFRDFVHTDDRSVFQALAHEELTESSQPFEIRLLAAEGAIVPVEVIVRPVSWKGRSWILGFARPCRERQEREVRLRRQLEQQKSRAMEALKSSLRIYQLNEKVKSTLALTTQLLKVESEEQLYRESVELLTNGEGMSYREATVLVLEGTRLRVAWSSNKRLPDFFSITENNRFSKAIRAGFPAQTEDEQWGNRELIFPLRSRDELLGLVEVQQEHREKVFFEDYRLIAEWQHDLLVQIADIIALLLENLRLNRELKRQSIIDPLTGAFNRNFFMTRLEAEVRRALRYSRPLSLLFIDIDLFKQINDRFGHLQGDFVLRELGGLFARSLRDVDLLCRYGGDEFIVVLPETTTETAAATADKILRAVREYSFRNLEEPEASISVTVSVGIGTLRPGQTAEDLLQLSDNALYQAKEEGRDRGATGV